MRIFLLLLSIFLFAQRREELQALGVSAQLSPLLSEEIREYALTDTNPDTAPILVPPISYARVTSAVSGAILRLPANYPELKRVCVFNIATNAVQIRAPTGFLINTASTYSLPSNRFLCLLRLSTVFRYYDYGTADATDAGGGNPLTNWLEDGSRNFTQGANAASIVFSVTDTGIRFSNTNPFIRVDSSNLTFRTSTTDRWRFTSTGNLESIAGDLIFTTATHKLRSTTDLFIDAQTSIKQQIANTTVLDIASSQITANQNVSVASGRNIAFVGDAVIRSGSTNTFALQRGTTSFLSFDGSTITFANPLSISSISSTGDLTLSSGSTNSVILRRGTTNQLVLDGSSATFSVEVRANTYTTQSSSADLIINAPTGRKISLRVNNAVVMESAASVVDFSVPIAFVGDATIRSGATHNFALQRGTTSFLTFNGTTITFANPISVSSISSGGDLTLSSGASNSVILQRGTSNQLVLDGTSATFFAEVRANNYTTQSSSVDLVINAPTGRKVSFRVNNTAVMEPSSSVINFSVPLAATADATIRSGSTNSFFLQRGTTNFLAFDGTTITLSNPVSVSSISSTGDLTLSSGSTNSLILRRGTTNQLVLDGTTATFSVEVKANTYSTQSSSADLIINAPGGRVISLRVNNTQVASVSSSTVTFDAPITVATINSPAATNLALNVPSGQEVRLQTGGTTRFALLNDRAHFEVPFIFPFPMTHNDSSFDALRGGVSVGSPSYRTSTLVPTQMGLSAFDLGSSCNEGEATLHDTGGLRALAVRSTSSTPSVAVQDAIKNVTTHSNYRLTFLNYLLPYGGERIQAGKGIPGVTGNCFHFLVNYFNITEWNTGKVFGKWGFRALYLNDVSSTHQRGTIPVFCFRNATGGDIDIRVFGVGLTSQNPDIRNVSGLIPNGGVSCVYGGVTAPANEAVLNEMLFSLTFHTQSTSNQQFAFVEFASYTKNNNARVLQNFSHFIR